MLNCPNHSDYGDFHLYLICSIESDGKLEGFKVLESQIDNGIDNISFFFVTFIYPSPCRHFRDLG
jgi:hypothetical protein